MKIRAIVAAGVVLALAGCADPIVKKAQEEVAAELSDPASAQFRQVRVIKQVGGTEAVCGEINAKNAYGGYVGFKDFAYHDGEIFLGDVADKIQARTRLCVMNGRSQEQFDADHAEFMARMKTD